MLGSEVLEVGIGMALLFLFVSLVATAAQEAVESVMKTRAGDLERGVRELLNDRGGTGLAKDLYEHPLIYSLFTGAYDPSKLGVPGRLNYNVDLSTEAVAAHPSSLFMSKEARQSLPSYIPASSFALALIDIVARGPAPDPTKAVAGTSTVDGLTTTESLREATARIPDERIRRVILSAIDAGRGDLDAVRDYLANWYDGTMDRVSGWYKRRSSGVVGQFEIVALGRGRSFEPVAGGAKNLDIPVRALPPFGEWEDVVELNR